jgi:hypothetical protein
MPRVLLAPLHHVKVEQLRISILSRRHFEYQPVHVSRDPSTSLRIMGGTNGQRVLGLCNNLSDVMGDGSRLR